VLPVTEDPMSHQLKLCNWKELEVYGIPYRRMHSRRLELKGLFPRGYGSATAVPLGWRMRSSSGYKVESS